MGDLFDYSITFIFKWIFLILAGYKDIHKSLNEFDYTPHRTTNYSKLHLSILQ